MKAYLHVYKELKSKIVDGAYKLGDKLPSKRNLSIEYGYSVITIEHALMLLSDEGYIDSRERTGNYVIYNADLISFGGEINEHKVREDSLSMSSIPEEFSVSLYARTVRKVIGHYQDYMFSRCENQGAYILREAISDYLRRSRGIDVLPDEILIGSGAEYLYGLISQIIDEKEIGIENPSYEKIERVYEKHALKVCKLDMGSDGIKSEALKSTPVRVLHVTPYSSYPTLITASASKKHEYLAWVKERKGIIVEDDYGSEFSMLGKSEDTLYALEPEESVIYLNTFSVTVSPSIRVGYMIFPKKRCKEFMDKISFYSCTVPLLEQLVLAEILNNGDFERHLNRVRRNRRKAKKNTALNRD